MSKSQLGNLMVGDVGWSEFFFYGLANRACANRSDFALIQASTGQTIINGKTGVGVSYRVNNTELMSMAGTSITIANTVNLVFSTSTGTKIGTATGQKFAFHNSTPVIQRAGAAQAAVATTGATNVTPFGFTTAAQADAIVSLVNELRAALVEKGLIKGAA